MKNNELYESYEDHENIDYVNEINEVLEYQNIEDINDYDDKNEDNYIAETIGNDTNLRNARSTFRTVTFNPNGGFVSPTSRQVQSGSTIGTLPTPSRSGHSFIGWFTSTSGGMQVFSNAIVNGNATIFARWQVQTVSATLSVNISSWNPTSSASNGSFTITTNQTLSSIVSTSNVNWLTVSGTGATRTMSVSANNSNSRTGTITVRTSNSSISRTISVTQAGNTVTLSVTPNSWNPSSLDNTAFFTISTNQAISTIVSTSNVNWLSVSGTGTVRTMRAITNTNTFSRTGTITVRNSNSSISRIISVTQAAHPTLTVDRTTWNVSNIDSLSSFNITTNQPISSITSTSNVSWIIVSGTGTNRTMRVLTNTSTNARGGTITIRTSDGLVSRTIQVVQSRSNLTPTLTIDRTSWNPTSSSSSSSFTITTNQPLNTIISSSNVSWLSLSNNTAATRNMSVTNNTSTSQRVGVISIIGSEPGLTRTITVTQAGVQNRTVTFNANGGTPTPANRTVANGQSLGSQFPTNPTRTSHRFIGWFNTSATTGGTEFTRNSIINSNTNLWARWQVNSPNVRVPQNNATVDLQPLNVTWDLISGASYTIQMRNLNTNQLVLTTRNLGIGTNSFTIAQNLLTRGHRFRIALSAVTNNSLAGWAEREVSVRTQDGDANDVMRFYMNQTEEPFASMGFGTTTIRASGCGILSIAMVIARRENITNVSRKQDIIRAIINNSLSGNLLLHSSTIPFNGTNYRVSRSSVRPSTFNNTIIQFPGHFVLAVNNNLIKDPGSRTIRTVSEAEARWGRQSSWWSVS
ncbi:MAG: InlB B-repeat-containing protein [Defluviitaleaceae bacterium]|nr:InlB B-repeat-containing protein [Defluviitaleaceae bacterium]